MVLRPIAAHQPARMTEDLLRGHEWTRPRVFAYATLCRLEIINKLLEAADQKTPDDKYLSGQRSLGE